MAKLPNRLVIEITNTDKVDELGYPVIGFESKDYAECVIEELEKIKEEIEGLEYYDFDCHLVLPAWKVYNIIDNYISELKGEENKQ